MIASVKTVKAHTLTLSEHEIKVLKEAREVINHMFGKVVSRENQSHFGRMIDSLDELLEYVDDLDGQFTEFIEEE